MTELEQLLAMLNRAGIPFEREILTDKPIILVKRGYSGFEVEFKFKANGELDDVGAYE